MKKSIPKVEILARDGVGHMLRPVENSQKRDMKQYDDQLCPISGGLAKF